MAHGPYRVIAVNACVLLAVTPVLIGTLDSFETWLSRGGSINVLLRFWLADNTSPLIFIVNKYDEKSEKLMAQSSATKTRPQARRHLLPEVRFATVRWIFRCHGQTHWCWRLVHSGYEMERRRTRHATWQSVGEMRQVKPALVKRHSSAGYNAGGGTVCPSHGDRWGTICPRYGVTS